MTVLTGDLRGTDLLVKILLPFEGPWLGELLLTRWRSSRDLSSFPLSEPSQELPSELSVSFLYRNTRVSLQR